MNIDNEVVEYLLGRKISNGYTFQVPAQREMFNRNELLRTLATGKNVLHVGCVDHVELIEKKRQSGQYLHDMLCGSANSVVGVDSNADGIYAMRDLGIPDLYSIDDFPPDLKFDLILIPDVIEHVGNVKDFLSLWKSHECPIVISTPNAYRLANRLQFRGELVNTDHKYWFSPYTLSRSVWEAGFEVVKYWYVDTSSIRRPFSSLIKYMYPLTRDGIVAELRLRG